MTLIDRELMWRKPFTATIDSQGAVAVGLRLAQSHHTAFLRLFPEREEEDQEELA